MARKKRQRISYVLPLAGRPGGHRLGINGLAIDHDRNILYTGGRDGVVCAWNLEDGSPKESNNGTALPRKKTTISFRREVQAHTDWVNDLVPVKNNLALASASNDSSVKLWRPHSHDTHAAYSIGTHSDYAKCLTVPGPNSDWIASGGLDYRICLWDLSGKGIIQDINIKKSENVLKASVYALKANGSMIASSGPEGVVRLWDTNSGKSITKLVGHTDLVRDILISADGETLLSASSDQTVKVWSVKEGRCVHTLTVHDDSVWCLYSEDPQLSVFYSGDKSGRVAKTDTRHAEDIDDAVSVAVCQENNGIHRLALSGNSIWTATQSSSLNRWLDVDTELEIEEPPTPARHERTTSSLSRSTHEPALLQATPSKDEDTESEVSTDGPLKKIPYAAILRLTNTAFYSGRRFTKQPNVSGVNLRKGSEAVLPEDLPATPIRHHPAETIDGQIGLKNHVMLNDKKRVLTLDTAGDIVLWDLLKCIPIRTYRGRSMDDVLEDENTAESVANWCTVDTKTGNLTVELEELYCFDAEVYADQTEFAGTIDFREDQRLNLGKWVLKSLFASLLDEEIRRDEEYRKSIKKSTGLRRQNAPTGLSLPSSINSSGNNTPSNLATPKANGGLRPAITPGIGLATPLPQPRPQSTMIASSLPTTAEERVGNEGTTPRTSTNSRDASSNDYFSQSAQGATPSEQTPLQKELPAATPGGSVPGPMPQSPLTDEKRKKGLFGKGFNMKMSFPKKAATEAAKNVDAAKTEDKPSEEEKSEESSEKDDAQSSRIVEDNFYGVVQKIRYAYSDHLDSEETTDQPVSIGIVPAPSNEAPLITPPAHTLILIREDDPDAGGLRDLYRGEISTLGSPEQADILEKIAPMWLGDLLLRNEIPVKDTVKVAFVLTPYQDLLPSIASVDNNARLNANRMLRTKKILGYVSERIEAPADPDNPKPGDELKPEEYMELLCNDRVVDPDMTLATLRVHVWRTGGDVALYYRANGKKEMRRAHPTDVVGKDQGAQVADTDAANASAGTTQSASATGANS